MANQYFVFGKRPELGATFVIENAEAVHHIFTVLRTQAGDKLRLVFDEGQLGLTEVVDSTTHSVRLLEQLMENAELPVSVTVAVGFPKGDKLDFIVEKATELGAAAIWAAPFAWSVARWDAAKREKKEKKLTKIAKGAAEQSRRTVIPQVRLFESVTALTERFTDFDQVLVAYEETAKANEQSGLAKALARKSRNLLIIFGPEGGIAPEEITIFQDHQARLIGLGPRILRAETAPLAALAMISALTELKV